MQPSIIAIMSILATIIAAVIGVSIPSLFKRYDDKRIRRIKPSISIWNNMRDDIDARLNNNALRWYVDLSKINSYCGNCLYIVIRSESEFMMCICEIKIEYKMKNDIDRKPQKYNVRLIDSKTRCVFPLMYTGEERLIIFKIKYNTEKSETMMYEVTFSIDYLHDELENRKDVSFIIRKNNKLKDIEEDSPVRRLNRTELKKYKNKIERSEKVKIKQLSLVKMEESDNFTSREIRDRLGEKGTLNNLRRLQNGNNN